MKSTSIDQFLATYFPQGPGGLPQSQLQAALMATRNRELFYRKYLPSIVVRRMDRIFARSNTVHPDTATILYRICRQSNARIVFETGTYWGYSTAYLALALDGREGARIFTFDIHPNAGQHIPKTLLPRIERVRGKPSTETMPRVLDQVVPDLFFQDSRHDFEGVRDELQIVAPRMQPGSVILFHDFVCPAVVEAAEKVLVDFDIFLIENADPQQVGAAIKRR
jgi:predicted O-methyltransferase YrrM